jgi:lipopolysaccharide transport protein LptA
MDFSDHISFAFVGNVVVVSDKFEMSSDRLEVISSKNYDFLCSGGCGAASIKKVHALGNVKFMQDCRRGVANEVTFDSTSDTITLLENARITTPDGTARGDKLYLNRSSNLVKVESSSRSTISIDDLEKLKNPIKN